MNTQELSYERGPIRPPNEARSLLLRFTRNCPWNRCQFCPVYKGTRFSLRSVDEICADIEAARQIKTEIQSISRKMGHAGKVTHPVAEQIFADPQRNDCFRSIAAWLYFGTNACFLQDADNMVMPVEDLVTALECLRENFPEIERVTTYARSRSIVRKSVQSLKRIRKAGLNRIHVGLESGSDAVLKLMQKGNQSVHHIEAGRKLRAAGLELSTYVMPGLGGRSLWREHATETARVLNQINPHFIRLRTLRIPPRIPLHQLVQEGRFEQPSDDEIVAEIALFLEHLEGIDSYVASDHIMNLLEEVCGQLPEDKARMLQVIADYQQLEDHERQVFRAGRRGGSYRSTGDLAADPHLYGQIENVLAEERKRAGDVAVERMISALADRYI